MTQNAMKQAASKKTVKNTIKLGAAILAGNLLIAFVVTVFVLPHGIIMGGSTGIALVLNRLFQFDTAVVVLILNVFFLFLGTGLLGRKFFFSTVASSVVYPFFLGIFQRLPLEKIITTDHLLAAIIGGVILGAGVGLVMRHGAGTGGTDSLALILNKWTHLPLAVLVSASDITILAAQSYFSSIDQILYGIVLTVVQSVALNKVVLMGQSQIQIFVVSDAYKTIRQKLLSDLRVGTTMVKIETGIAGKEQEGLLSVIHPRRLYEVNEMIQSIDPSAFITIVQAKEVRGQGFTLDRVEYQAG